MSSGLPGRVFGKYDVVRKLAAGGMGEIFFARQTGVVDRLVILKSLLPELNEQPASLTSFLDEARILGSINHPNVVGLLDVGDWQGQYFIAMEYIHGVDLNGLLRHHAAHNKRLPPGVSMQIVRDAAVGLDAAHFATDALGEPLRIVHRDISPHNLMVRQDGVVKLVDFGVALADIRESVPEVGVVKGKLGYIPPEQIRSLPSDGRADQFALGVVLWELLTQRRLYPGDDSTHVFTDILQKPAPAPSTMVADVPPELDAIVLRMLSHDRIHRYARMNDVATALRRALEAMRVPDNHTQQYMRQHLGPELGARMRELTQGLQQTQAPRMPTPVSGPIPASAPAPTSTPSSMASTAQPTAVSGEGKAVMSVSLTTPSTSSMPPTTPTAAPATRQPGLAHAPTTSTAQARRVDFPPPSAPVSTKAAAPVAAMLTPIGTTGLHTLEIEPAVADTELAVVVGEIVSTETGHAVDQLREELQALATRLHMSVRIKGLRFSVALAGEGSFTSALSFAYGALAAAQPLRGVALRMLCHGAPAGPAVSVTQLRVSAEPWLSRASPRALLITPPLVQRVPSYRRQALPSDHPAVQAADGMSLWLVHPPAHVAGRERDIDRIDALLAARFDDNKQTDRPPAQMLVVGESGMGKTTVLRAALTMARRSAWLCGWADAGVSEVVRVGDIMRQLIVSVARAKMELDKVSGASDRGAWMTVLGSLQMPAPYAAVLRHFVDGTPHNNAGISPPRRRQVLRAAVHCFFTKATARHPLLLCVDDLHAADATSIEMLTSLCGRLADARMMVLASTKPQQGARTLPLAARTMLEPLPSEAATRAAMLMCARLGTSLTTQASAWVAQGQRSPLSMDLLARRLAHPQAAKGDGGWQHDHLSEGASALMRGLAVLGELSDVVELPRLLPADTDVVFALDELQQRGILQRRADAEDLWAFRSATERAEVRKHPGCDVWRAAIAAPPSPIPPPTLQLGLERVAFMAAQRGHNESTLAWRVGLADVLESLGLHDAAVSAWGALSNVPFVQWPKHTHLASRWILALLETDAAAALQHADAALLSSSDWDIDANASLHQARAAVLRRLRRFDDAERGLRLAIDVAHVGTSTPALLAGLQLDLALVLEASNQLEPAYQAALQALQHSDGQSSLRSVEAFLVCGRIEMKRRQPDAAVELLSLCVGEAQRISAHDAELEALSALVGAHQLQGKLDDALVRCTRAVELATRVDDPLLQARALQLQARVWVSAGRQADAASALQSALSFASTAGWDEGQSAAKQLLSVIAAT
jgi:eukaryotic-like serine/threonine-protein kinase